MRSLRPRLHDCAVDTCLELIAGKWKPLILWKISQHPSMRFGELQRAIPDITKKMLTQQLREMERDCLITRAVYPSIPRKVEYALSEFGETLQPLLDAAAEWGQQHKHHIRAILREQEAVS